MPYTIYVEETNAGHVTFATEQEANDWTEEPNFDLIEWTDQFDFKTSEIVKEDS